MNEAAVKDTEHGRVVDGPGWFALNLGDAAWERKGEFGARCRVESPQARFEHFAINAHVLMPGEANALYHAESAQEGFLVLAGECLAIVEGSERRLRQWDYLHCPPGTAHVLVGVGDGPCAILMVGAPRSSSLSSIHYPAEGAAARHGAAASATTDSSKQAYADRDAAPVRVRAPWPTARSAPAAGV